MPGPMGGPGRPGMNTQAKAKNFKATTKKLINNYLSKYKLAITIVITIAIAILLMITAVIPRKIRRKKKIQPQQTVEVVQIPS